MKTPLVSIVVTCYNKKPYLGAAFESVEKQTYENVEVIVVDDGSTDGSGAFLKEYVASHAAVKLITQTNQGVSAARNVGIRASHGTYVMTLDADDCLEPSYVERCVEVLENHPEVKVVQTRASYFGAKTGEFRIPQYSYEKLLWTNLIPCCAMYRRSDFLECSGYNTNMVHGLEDWDFWLTMLKPDDQVFCIDEILFNWRVLPDSRSIEAEQHELECYQQLYHNHRELYDPYLDRLVYFREKWLQSDTLYQNAVSVRQSVSYRVGKLVISPIVAIRKLFSRH